MESMESIEVIDPDGVKETNFAFARELTETQAPCRNVSNMTMTIGHTVTVVVMVMFAIQQSALH